MPVIFVYRVGKLIIMISINSRARASEGKKKAAAPLLFEEKAKKRGRW